jgi:hypothetical protein
MHHHLGLALLLFLGTACSAIEDKPMAQSVFGVTVTCQGQRRCVFDGRDLNLEILVTNHHRDAIGFPLAFRQKTGPMIRLSDTRTKAQTLLKTNLADLDLRERFTTLPPGESVRMEWVITGDELLQFGSRDLDVLAEVTVAATVAVGSRRVDGQASDTLRIVGKNHGP